MTNSTSSNSVTDGQSGTNSDQTNVKTGVEPLPGSLDNSEKNNGIHDYATRIDAKVGKSNIYYKSYPYCITPSTFYTANTNRDFYKHGEFDRNTGQVMIPMAYRRDPKYGSSWIAQKVYQFHGYKRIDTDNFWNYISPEEFAREINKGAYAYRFKRVMVRIHNIEHTDAGTTSEAVVEGKQSNVLESKIVPEIEMRHPVILNPSLIRGFQKNSTTLLDTQPLVETNPKPPMYKHDLYSFLSSYGANTQPRNHTAHVPESVTVSAANTLANSGASLVELYDTKIVTPFDTIDGTVYQDGLNGTDMQCYIKSTPTGNTGTVNNTGEKYLPYQTANTGGDALKKVSNPLDDTDNNGKGQFKNYTLFSPEQEYDFTSNNAIDNAPTKVISDQDAFEWSNPSNKFIVFEKPNVTGSNEGYYPNEFLDRLNYDNNYKMPMVENEFFETLRTDTSERRSHGMQGVTPPTADPLPLNPNFDDRKENCSKNNIPAYLIRTMPKLSVSLKDGDQICAQAWDIKKQIFPKIFCRIEYMSEIEWRYKPTERTFSSGNMRNGIVQRSVISKNQRWKIHNDEMVPMIPKIQYNSLSPQSLTRQQMTVSLLKPDECYPFTLCKTAPLYNQQSAWKNPPLPAIRKPTEPISSEATQDYKRRHTFNEKVLDVTQQASIYAGVQENGVAPQPHQSDKKKKKKIHYSE